MKQQTISKWENGTNTPGRETIRRYLDALELPEVEQLALLAEVDVLITTSPLDEDRALDFAGRVRTQSRALDAVLAEVGEFMLEDFPELGGHDQALALVALKEFIEKLEKGAGVAQETRERIELPPESSAS